MDHSCMGVLKFIELEKEYTGHFTLNFDFFIDFVATSVCQALPDFPDYS